VKVYLKQDISKRIGRSISVVQSWVDQGLVLPEAIPAQGRGFVRAYSEKNLVEFSFVNVLLSFRMRLETIRDIMKHLRQTERLKDFFTSSRWEKDYGLIFSMDYESGSPSNILFRIVQKEGSSLPVEEKVVEKVKDEDNVIYVKLERVLAEAKTRLGME